MVLLLGAECWTGAWVRNDMGPPAAACCWCAHLIAAARWRASFGAWLPAVPLVAGMLCTPGGFLASLGSCNFAAGYEGAVPRLVRVLARMRAREVGDDYTYYGIASPWLQVRLAGQDVRFCSALQLRDLALRRPGCRSTCLQGFRSRRRAACRLASLPPPLLGGAPPGRVAVPPAKPL